MKSLKRWPETRLPCDKRRKGSGHRGPSQQSVFKSYLNKWGNVAGCCFIKRILQFQTYKICQWSSISWFLHLSQELWEMSTIQRKGNVSYFGLIRTPSQSGTERNFALWIIKNIETCGANHIINNIDLKRVHDSFIYIELICLPFLSHLLLDIWQVIGDWYVFP